MFFYGFCRQILTASNHETSVARTETTSAYKLKKEISLNLVRRKMKKVENMEAYSTYLRKRKDPSLIYCFNTPTFTSLTSL